MITFEDCLEMITITFRGNKMKKFKKGDKVKIRDSSYSRIIIDGELRNGEYEGVRHRKCTVIEVGCDFPRTSDWNGVKNNNTVVQDCETGEIIFILERFLEMVAHVIVIDGKTIELSHKSFLAFKEQLV